MAVNGAVNDASLLFACTRCNSRYPFEDLSPDLLLCKECRDSFVQVKCTYCRAEFQHENANNIKKGANVVCPKCEQNIKKYGKPTTCQYCSLNAAFMGKKCPRCAYSEKKYGPPVPCEQCRQKCAFDRKEERKKLNGKQLCWLCTVSYKRTMAKTQSKNSTQISSYGGHKRDKSGLHLQTNQHSNGVSNASNGAKKHRGEMPPWQPPPTMNGISSATSQSVAAMSSNLPTFQEESASDITSGNVVAVTQLREKILNLDRQLKTKNQELLKKDVKITELKSEIAKEQRECRDKIQEMQKKYNERIQELQQKITVLSKQLATLQKSSKKTNGSADGSPVINF